MPPTGRNHGGPPPDEFICVESARFKGQIPRDVSEVIPNLTILYIDAQSSYKLKNRSTQATTRDWLAIVDAVRVSQCSWLKVLRADIAEHPDVGAISGKTSIRADVARSVSWVFCPGHI